jgi:hypothetical protein
MRRFLFVTLMISGLMISGLVISGWLLSAWGTTPALDPVATLKIEELIQTLKKRDFVASQLLIAGDRTINERRHIIEEDTIALVATQ